MKTAFQLSILSLLTPLLGAQEQSGAAAAWDRFTADQAPATFHAEWNLATGTPEAIYGDGLRVAPRVIDLAHARLLSGDVLERHADLLGRGGSTFVESIGQQVRHLYIFVYDQQYAGLEVVSGRADVRLNQNGVVGMFGAKSVEIPAGFVTKPGIPMEMAWAIAHDHLKVQPMGQQLAIAPSGKLVIWADVESKVRSQPRLSWRVGVDVRNGEALTVGDVYVDALTGEAFRFENRVYQCAMGHEHVTGERADHVEAKGHIGREIARNRAKNHAALPVDITGTVRAWMNKGDPLTPRTNEPLAGVRVTATGIGSALTDINGNFTIPFAGTGNVSLTVSLGAGNGEFLGSISPLQGTLVSTTVNATAGIPAQIQLLAPNPAEFDWSQTTTFWHTDDVNRWVRGIVGNIPTTRINMRNMTATVNRASTCNAFYTNNTINFYATGGSCNMTAYNSVVYHEWGHGVDDAFGGISQTDGLSEGWGDMLAILRLADPIVGRNFTTTGGIVRTALNTFTYPAGGGVHQQGQTWMGFGWNLRGRLITKLGASAGALVTEQIIVGTLPANATNQPNAVREVFLLDDNDGNLNNGTPNCTEILAAAQSRNLPTPIARCSGSWTAYGQGCPGSGQQPSFCASLNTNGGAQFSNSFTNEYCYGNAATTAGVLDGFQLHTVSTTGGNATVEVRVYRESSPGSGTPSQTAVSTGSITVGTSVGWYSATLNSPVAFAAGERLWISQRQSDSIRPASLTSGQTAALTTYFRRTAGGTTWGATGSVLWPAWRWVCQGGGIPGARPQMTGNGAPLIGQNFGVSVSQAAPSAPAALLLGFSNSTWAGLNLPAELSAFGAAGCSLLTSIDIVQPSASNAGGIAGWTIPIPNDVALVGQHVFSQALIVDAPANAAGLVFSNGGDLEIGRP
ncbi:MAG: hypothetical protein AB7I19_05410 [Planctomycetota bacterium]